MRYINEGHAITVPFKENYSIEAKIKSNKNDAKSYVITLLLVDHDTDESWKIEEGIKAESEEPQRIKICVVDSIEKLIKLNYFDNYVKKWEYRKELINSALTEREHNNDL